MKKFGFTLAEVLVTLGIVGVIAAMTVPSISSNANNRANAAKLSATITTLETAISNMMLDEGVDDFYDIDNFSEKWLKYLKASKKNSSVLNDEKVFPALNKNQFLGTINAGGLLTSTDIKSKNSDILLLKNGAYVIIVLDGAFGLASQKNKTVIINTGKGSGIVGRDMFLFVLLDDGHLCPYGGQYKYTCYDECWKGSRNKWFACSDSFKGGGCTARLIENNFVVDY